MMVKLTVVGRVSDGLPISQGPPLLFYHEDDDDNEVAVYKKHAEFLLREISMAALPPSTTTVTIHRRRCFNYMVKNGVCFMTLCDASYPRKLAFHYLEDLHKEFEKIDPQLVNQITKPYSLLKFDHIISNIRRQYMDTRTQTNLSKLNANNKQELDVLTVEMSTVIERRRKSDILERMMKAHKSSSAIWGSKTLEVIAVKWTPITIIFVLAFVLLWSGLKVGEEND